MLGDVACGFGVLCPHCGCAGDADSACAEVVGADGSWTLALAIDSSASPDPVRLSRVSTRLDLSPTVYTPPFSLLLFNHALLRVGSDGDTSQTYILKTAFVPGDGVIS